MVAGGTPRPPSTSAAAARTWVSRFLRMRCPFRGGLSLQAETGRSPGDPRAECMGSTPHALATVRAPSAPPGHGGGGGASLAPPPPFPSCDYGVTWLTLVDQLPSAVRDPAAPGEGAQVPSLLSPVVALKNCPPHVL